MSDVQQVQVQDNAGQPTQLPPEPPRKRRFRKVLIWSGVVVAGLYVLGTISEVGETPSQARGPEKQDSAKVEKLADASKATKANPAKSEAKSQPKPEPKSHATVGQPVNLGDSVWTVTNAYPTTKLKDIYGLDPAKRGSFVVVEMVFRNGTPEAVTLDPGMHMTLTDATGREFSPDTDTFSYVPSNKDLFLNQVNPGVTQDGMVIFTVAPDAQGFTFHGQDMDFWSDKEAKIDLDF
jgi:hypothetical protein